MILSASLFVTASALFAPTFLRADAEESDKNVDVWILAGQSNAAGFSYLSQDVYGQEDISYRELLTQADTRNGSGYSDVFYYGATEVRADAQMPSISLVEAQIGQGANGNYIGPELGMANVLADSYTDSSPAAIFKFAVGGTYLCDFEGAGQQTKDFGNWSSPSMTEQAKQDGITLHANNGKLYERLLNVVETGIDALEKQGYTPSIKGYVWMQGEADAVSSQLSSRYESSLKMFIEDLRSDVAEIAKDEKAALRPFVIGKICPSGAYGNYISAVRAAEDAVAAQLPYVYLVDTQDLRITNEDGTPNGSDAYHFNAADMYELGKRFAQTATANLAKYSYTVTAGAGGSAEKSVCLSDGESFQVAYTCDRGKALGKVLINGSDVTQSCVKDGVITIVPSVDSEPFNTIELVFVDLTAHKLTVNVGMGGRIERSPSGSVIYDGEEIVIKVIPSTDYVVDKVLVNGTQTEASEDGKFHATAEGDTDIQVTFKLAGTAETDPTDPGKEEPNGGLIAAIVVGCVVVVAVGVTVGILAYKKHKQKS